MKATVNMLNGEKRRLNLPNPIWTGYDNYSLGVALVAIHVGKRSHRVVINTYSIWENPRTYCVEGEEYFEIDDGGITELSAKYPKLAEVVDSWGIEDL